MSLINTVTRGLIFKEDDGVNDIWPHFWGNWSEHGGYFLPLCPDEGKCWLFLSLGIVLIPLIFLDKLVTFMEVEMKKLHEKITKAQDSKE